MSENPKMCVLVMRIWRSHLLDKTQSLEISFEKGILDFSDRPTVLKPHRVLCPSTFFRDKCFITLGNPCGTAQVFYESARTARQLASIC